MAFQVLGHHKSKRLSLALIIFFICIQTVYLADQISENGVSSTDFPETSIDSEDSNLNKTNQALHPILQSITKINKSISSISPAPKLSKDISAHVNNTSEIGKIIAGKTFQHLPSELKNISKSEDESATSEPETTVFSITEGGEKSSEEPSATQASAAEKPPEYTFAVLDIDGKVCSLAKFDAVIVITAITKVTVHLPKNATADGTCNENENIMKLSWPKFNFIMGFSKIRTDDEDEWALTNLTLQYHHKDVFHIPIATTITLNTTGSEVFLYAYNYLKHAI